MTEKFVSAAELMAQVLGVPGYEFVIIPHPISSANDEALRAAAEKAADECARLLIRTA